MQEVYYPYKPKDGEEPFETLLAGWDVSVAWHEAFGTAISGDGPTRVHSGRALIYIANARSDQLRNTVDEAEISFGKLGIETDPFLYKTEWRTLRVDVPVVSVHEVNMERLQLLVADEILSGASSLVLNTILSYARKYCSRPAGDLDGEKTSVPLPTQGLTTKVMVEMKRQFLVTRIWKRER